MLLKIGDTQLEPPYTSPIVGIFSQPQALGADVERRHTPDTLRDSLSHSSQYARSRERKSMYELMFSRAHEAAENSPFFDTYFVRQKAAKRTTVLQEIVDFSGLPTVLPSATNNMAMLVAELEDRFTQKRLDKRMVGMRVRQRTTVSADEGD